MVGRSVSQYRFLEKLGAGGMGEIYKAQDTRLNRIVAVKVLPSAKSGDPERRRRFLQEAQAASGLNHPSIITIHDVISEGDTEFMVMEYVAGKTLNDLIPKGGLRVPQALKYALQMSDALATAHSAGIVHRDLKPANVMVTDSGLVKVLDFGLAKLTDPNPVGQIGQDAETVSTSSPLTVEGSILGTVNYMSPEQAQGRKVDVRSDIFSFGVVLYEMLTGLRAFEGETSLSTLSAILRDEAKPMIEVAPDVPPQLESVIQRCLRKNPDDRWLTMKEVQMALSALKRESDSGSLYTSRIAPPRSPSGESPSRIPPASNAQSAAPALTPGTKMNPMIGIAVLAVVLIAGGGAWWMMKRQAAQKTADQAAAAQVQTAAESAPVETPAPLPTDPVAAAPAEVVLNNDMVLEMVKEKLPTGVILSQIRSSKTNFDFSTAEVIRLSKGGVSGSIIETMRDPKRVPSQPSGTQTSAKQTTPAPAAAPVTASKPVLPTPAPAPTPVPIAAAPSQPLVATPTVAPTPQSVSVSVPDGLPFRLILAADVPADADLGRPLRFTAAEDFRVQGMVVIPKGAPITGEISETPKKKLFGIGGGKLSFKLNKADAAGGQSMNVRAAGAKRSDGPTQRAVEAGTKPGSKDIAASQGTEYIGYIDGAQSVSVPQK